MKNKNQIAGELYAMFDSVKDSEGNFLRYAFSMDTVENKGEAYEKVSELIRKADLDMDSAYQWTVEALEDLNDWEGYEEATEDAIGDYISEVADNRTPVYNNVLTNWLSLGTNWALVDDMENEGLLVNGDGIIKAIMLTYCVSWDRHARAVNEIINELHKGQK